MSRASESTALSRREREVAALVAEGLTDRSIAKRLFLSERTVEDHVLQIRNKLGLDNRTQIATWLAGYGRGGEGTAPPVSTPPSSLPPQVTSFVGRRRELGRARSLLQRTRSLTITGPGGCGKTRLAIEIAGEVLHRYPDGVWFVDLSGTTDPDVVLHLVASALGIAEREDPDSLDAVAAGLTGDRRRRRSLLVLDNCEHLVERCATLVATLVRASPHLSFLCTSREPLHVPGEAIWRLDPLPVPELSPRATAAGIVGSEAVQLFLERAGLSDPRFELDDANAADVARLCQRLDGIPLALELAAAHVGLVPFDELLRHLELRFGDPHVRGVPDRQRTLAAAIDWSYALLDERERRLLRHLSVFAGGFVREAVEAVCAEGREPDQPGVAGMLALLVDKSLVQPVPPRTQRYRCLEIIRRDAWDRLRGSGELPAVRRRHLDYFLDLAERATSELWGPNQAAWFERLTDDHENLRLALETSRSVDLSRRLRLVVALNRFWQVRGHLREGRRWTEEALAAAPGTTATPLHADALNRAAGLAWQQGDLVSAQTHLEAGLAICRALGDRGRVQSCLANLAVLASTRSDWPAAMRLSAEGLALAREIGDERMTAAVLGNRGLLVGYLGQHAAAQELLEEALDLSRRTGDSLRAAVMLANLGAVALYQGRDGEAAGRYAESLRLLRALHARQNLAECLEGFAWIAARAGDRERALRLAGAAASMREALGTPHQPWSQRLVEEWLGEAWEALGPDAERPWGEGRELSEDEAIALALDERPAGTG